MQRSLENGSVQGDGITFHIPAGSGMLVFDLKIKGDEISGTSEIRRNGQTVKTGRVSLKRQ